MILKKIVYYIQFFHISESETYHETKTMSASTILDNPLDEDTMDIEYDSLDTNVKDSDTKTSMIEDLKSQGFTEELFYDKYYSMSK